MGMLRRIWFYRGFILLSVKREFQSKYPNSLLGAAWTVIRPLSMILVYTIIFSQVMRAKLPGVESTFGYSIYLCAGIITWGFAEIASPEPETVCVLPSFFKFLVHPGPGTYSVQKAPVSSDTHLENNYEWRDLALVFNVVNMSRTHFAGSSWIEPEIEIVT